MSGFTPGPWSVGKEYTPDGLFTYFADAEGCTVDLSDPANARLIAAAPDLLECVKELKELFRFALLSTTPQIARDGMEYVRKAEAAISKAVSQPSEEGK